MLEIILYSLIISTTTVSSQSSIKTNTTKLESYQVTENVIDIPDNRTLSPIIPNYGIYTPLNMANTSIINNNNSPGTNNNGNPHFGTNNNGPPEYGTHNNGNPEYGTNNNGQPNFGANNNGQPNYGANNNGPPDYGTNNNGPLDYGTNNNGPPNYGPLDNKDGTKNNTPSLKRNSFSILHIKVEMGDYPKKEGGIKKVFTGIKDYFHSIRKGVVDGLHSFFHRNDDKIEGQWRNEPHGEDEDENVDDFKDIESERFNDEYDDDFKHEFEHY